MNRSLLPCLLFALLAGLAAGTAARAEERMEFAPGVSHRQPVALCSLDDLLIVGNQRSGSLSIIDSRRGLLVGEYSVAERIGDMLPLGNQPSALLVLDIGRGQLLRVDCAELASGRADAQIARSTLLRDLPRSPMQLAAGNDHRWGLSSRWGRCVYLLTLDDQDAMVQEQLQVKLPFSPGELVFVDDKRLLVADAFGGQLAIVDAVSGDLLRVRELEAANIRGLGLSPDRTTIYLTHQQLNPIGRTEFDDVHWGTLLTHALRTIPVCSLIESDRNLDDSSDVWLEELGRAGRGSADAGPLWIGENGSIAIAILGVGEVRISHRSYRLTFSVGKQPSAFCRIDNKLFVANRLDDTVSCFDLDAGAVTSTISLGPRPELTARDRGERLFYSARLSHDGWMSCNTCHADGHTTNQLVDTLGDDDYGAPKRIPSLLGVSHTGPWAWNGQIHSLQSQVQKSIRTTMHGEPLNDRETTDLVAYLRSLTAPPHPTPKAPEDQVLAGQELFGNLGCRDCHQPPHYTSDGAYDIGLTDEKGRTKFNPPSLLGVSQRDRLFHDGRARGVEEVIRKFRHQLPPDIPPDDLKHLLAFLRSL